MLLLGGGQQQAGFAFALLVPWVNPLIVLTHDVILFIMEGFYQFEIVFLQFIAVYRSLLQFIAVFYPQSRSHQILSFFDLAILTHASSSLQKIPLGTSDQTSFSM